MHRPRYWLRLVTDLGHKKRAMEALRACEKALSEASCPTWGEESTRSRMDATRAPPDLRAPSPVAAAEVVAEEAAAILPLGESLPLLRRAVRLAVPPLRWRKRPPPELREAQLRVMSLDLSWRRLGRGSGSTLPPRSLPAGPANSPSQLRVLAREVDDEENEEGEGGAEDDGGVDRSKANEVGRARGGGQAAGSGKVAPGTSLEQAVLDELLAELGPGWKGLHAENRRVFGQLSVVLVASYCHLVQSAIYSGLWSFGVCALWRLMQQGFAIRTPMLTRTTTAPLFPPDTELFLFSRAAAFAWGSLLCSVGTHFSHRWYQQQPQPLLPPSFDGRHHRGALCPPNLHLRWSPLSALEVKSHPHRIRQVRLRAAAVERSHTRRKPGKKTHQRYETMRKVELLVVLPPPVAPASAQISTRTVPPRDWL